MSKLILGPKALRVYPYVFLNAQSIKATDKYTTKFIDYKNMVYTLRPDIFAINETWLTEFVEEKDVIGADLYKPYKLDRESIVGGGVLTLVSTSIWSKERKDLIYPSTYCNEIVAVEIRPVPNRKIILINCYRSQAHLSRNFQPNLVYTLNECARQNLHEIILLGDFNYSDIKWDPLVDTNLPKECRIL